MLIQLIEKQIRGSSDVNGYHVWLAVGTKSVLLRLFRHGTEALKYAEDVSALLNCAVQYSYEKIVLDICTRADLYERMES